VKERAAAVLFFLRENTVSTGWTAFASSGIVTSWDRRLLVTAGLFVLFVSAGSLRTQASPPNSLGQPARQTAVPANRAASRLGNDAVPNGTKHELGRVVQIELLQDVRAVRLHGGWTHAQHLRDLLVAVALRDQLKDLAFSLR
jgi:hypothetical protein